MKDYSPFQFAFFRIILGLFLAISFLRLIPYASELWSDHGMIPNASTNLTYGWFPDILNHYDSPFMVYCFIGILFILSILFTLGIYRRLTAFLLWYGWVCLFNRNNLVAHPGYPFISWFLLVYTVVPAGESLSLGKKRDPNWEMPKVIWIGCWIILAIGYSYSGIEKIMDSPSWRNGYAVKFVLDSILARDYFLTNWVRSAPAIVLKIFNEYFLFLECLYVPLCLFKRTRMYAWIGMVLAHISILLLVDITDVSLIMILIHLFLFDSSWIKPKGKRKNQIIFYDNNSAWCNSFVNVIKQEDRTHVFKVAPLQKTSSDKNVSDSIILSNDTVKQNKSTAVINIFTALGGGWYFMKLLLVCPRYIRDKIYELVAE